MEKFYTPRKKFISVALIVFASIMLTLTGKVQSQVTVTVTNIDSVLCFGDSTGSITVSASGGTPPYTYLWNTTPTQTAATALNLPAGTYTVTVNDNGGSSATQSATVYEPSQLNASMTSNIPVTCYGLCDGTATATASGGTPPYNYYWSNGQTGPVTTGLCVGTSTITVTDAAGCSVVAGVIIDQPPPPATLYLNAVDVLCYGDSTGAVELNYTDIQPTDTYMWSNGEITQDIVFISAGLYCVTVTTIDSCVRIACITITQPTALVISLIPIDEDCPYSCDGSIQSTVSGGTPGYNGYTYLWTDGQTTDDATLLCDGTYGVTVTDSLGCQVEDMADVSTSWQITADATANPVSGYFPLSVNFTFTGSGATSYLWDFGDGTSPSTDQNPLHIYSTEGIFDVMLAAYSDAPYYCMDTSHFSISVLDPFLIEESAETNNSIYLFPNPVTDNLQIESVFQINELEITDITGRLLHTTTSKTLPSRQAGIDCSSFAKGVYFIRIETEKGIAVMKFVKG